MWYLFYFIAALFVLAFVLVPLGPIGLIVGMGIVIYLRDLPKDKMAKFDAFLKRHRMPPFHKDEDVKS